MSIIKTGKEILPTSGKDMKNCSQWLIAMTLGKVVHPFKLIKSIRIQTRLITAFLIISLVPLLITGIYTYEKSSEAIESKISTYSNQIINQVNGNIESKLTALMDFSEGIISSDFIQNNLDSYDSLKDEGKFNHLLELREYLTSNKITYLNTISDMRIYTNTGESQNYNLSYGFIPDGFDELKKISEINKGIPAFVPVNMESNNAGVALAREIYSERTFERIGFLYIAMLETKISDIYRNIDLGKSADILILNSKGIVVSSRNPDNKCNSPYRDNTLISGILESEKSKVSTFEKDFNGSKSLVAFSHILHTDWYLIDIIPFSYINSESSKTGIYIAWVALVCFLIAVLLTLVITRSISSPLKFLMRQMDEVKKGNLSFRIKNDSNDEFAEVTSNFNIMLEELNKLIADVKKNEREKSLAELKALQAQINPHFLSNTLNTVKWLATIQNAGNISNLVTALIQLLHSSMGKGDELINIGEELENVKNYINIQEYKYCDKFEVQFDIDESILNCKIPKFTIQPIVENAILHGIEPMEGKGIISLKGAKYDDDIMLMVTDNGVGFSQDKLNSLQWPEIPRDKKRFSGIGVKNVSDRIKLYFGEQYGISVDSLPNIYTKVKIKIPAVYSLNI